MHVRAVVQQFETFGFLFGGQFGRFHLRQFVDVEVAESGFGAVRLQFDLFDREDRLAAVPEVFEDHVVDYLLAVQQYGDAVAYHLDVECIPSSQLIVGHFGRLARIDLVVVESAGTDFGAHVTARRIPDLHLRRTAQVNARIGLATFGIEFPIDVHFEIAVLFFGADVVESVSDVFHQSVVHYPVLAHRFVCGGLFLGQFRRFHLGAGDRVFDKPFPPGQVFAVEHRDETARRRQRSQVFLHLFALVIAVLVFVQFHSLFQ